jgi:hypothetical protein
MNSLHIPLLLHSIGMAVRREVGGEGEPLAIDEVRP